MSNLDVDMQAYRLTDEQKAAMHRMLKNEADAEYLLTMLGVIGDEQVATPRRTPVKIRCAKHNENKYRTRAGNLRCLSCEQERHKQRSK